MTKFLTKVGLTLGALAFSANIYAAVPLYTVNVGINGFGYGRPSTVSQSFSLTASYNLTALGLFDSGHLPYAVGATSPVSRQGFYETHTVSLLNASSAIVAQTTFAAGTTANAGPGFLLGINIVIGPGRPPLNVAQFRYLDVATTLLAPGRYTLVSTWGGISDAYVAASGAHTAADGVEMNLASVQSSGSISVYTPGTVSFASNLLLEPATVSPIPEPSEVAMMMAGLGVVAALSRRRKARAKPSCLD
jgi:hypothetical protein